MATDRRTKYTKSVIRQALFDLLKEKPLNKITVTDICKMADITFMGLHGSIGEDGKLQAMFDVLDIHYTGPNALSCTLSMNMCMHC